MKEWEETLAELYADNAKKLRRICRNEMRKFGGISQKDYDDFYSRVNYELAMAGKNYSPSKECSFMEYIKGMIRFSVKKEMTGRNRKKRLAEKKADSFETPIGADGLVLGDTLVSDFDMERVLEDKPGYGYGERAARYLANLSEIQRRIIQMKVRGVPVLKIRERLSLTEKQYEQHVKGLKAFANLSILYERNDESDIKEERPDKSMYPTLEVSARRKAQSGEIMDNNTVTQTMEKSKPDKLCVASIIKKMDRHTIRFDHPLQRESEQWSPSMKGNLVSDILQGNPIPALVFAEQIVNDIAIIWDLDGKQRCTNAYSFTKDGYRITKNIRRWMIEYQAPVADKDGKPVFDENHFPVYEKKEYDIRGKKFSELPEELQERFCDYNFEIVQYLNCSGDDIAYHIARYNEGKPMTVSQKGITRLSEEYAGMVKSISGMPFFKDIGGYKISETKNGTINRVVIESMMAVFFLNDWKKKQEDMCEYIRDHAKITDFDTFEEMVQRLERAVAGEAADMFDSKDSFLWFGLFARFLKTGKPDHIFVRFMIEFRRSLQSKKVSGISFDDLNRKSTKDRNVVICKMNHLETLLKNYLKQEG